MDALKPLFESGRIDFKGQQLANNVSGIVLLLSAVAAFATGITKGQISLCFYTYLAGVALAYLLVLPPWFAYNRTPVKWLAKKTAGAAQQTLVDSPNQPAVRKTLVEDVSDDDSLDG
ncbi:hypothetical protein GGI07_000783 [Coemansia sp. Benny D115]|nr:hypothetical protein GGI07_000783 [Coemansia sp. Benny D115]